MPRVDPIDIAAFLDDRPADGVFRVDAAALRSQALFDLEMKHIFEGGWVFVGVDFQAPEKHDFFTTWIGRQPVIVTRDAGGALHCLVNACRHRGSLVCHLMSGNQKQHICHYHGWAYDSAGRNILVKGEKQGGYPAAFASEDHGLKPVARFAEYRGFLFASLSPDVPALDEFLGDTKIFIDLIVDQGKDGLELVPGAVTYTFAGNWKMQLENSADVYHFTSTHPSLIQIVGRRKPPGDNAQPASIFENFRERELKRGSFRFAHGHSLMWGTNPSSEARPLYRELDALVARVGETRARWMFHTRNLFLFPNLLLLENASLQIRIIRPLGVAKTEITTHCIAPKGESREARTLRIRQYEEFFNPSGLATPDDTVIFEDCQAANQSDSVQWHQGYMRGLSSGVADPERYAEELGITAESALHGSFELGDETIFHVSWREWRRRLESGIAKDAATGRGGAP
jgi:benzoate/toluate 1,2-dioxygenase alpha subunit